MPSPRLAVVPLSSNPDELSLQLDGELDAFSVRDLVARLDELRAAGRVDVRLDMTQVTFVDSAGLQALIEQDEVFRQEGGRLVVERPAGPVRRVLQLAELAGQRNGLVAE